MSWDKLIGPISDAVDSAMGLVSELIRDPDRQAEIASKLEGKLATIKLEVMKLEHEYRMRISELEEKSGVKWRAYGIYVGLTVVFGLMGFNAVAPSFGLEQAEIPNLLLAILAGLTGVNLTGEVKSRLNGRREKKQ